MQVLGFKRLKEAINLEYQKYLTRKAIHIST